MVWMLLLCLLLRFYLKKGKVGRFIFDFSTLSLPFIQDFQVVKNFPHFPLWKGLPMQPVFTMCICFTLFPFVEMAGWVQGGRHPGETRRCHCCGFYSLWERQKLHLKVNCWCGVILCATVLCQSLPKAMAGWFHQPQVEGQGNRCTPEPGLESCHLSGQESGRVGVPLWVPQTWHVDSWCGSSWNSVLISVQVI